MEINEFMSEQTNLSVLLDQIEERYSCSVPDCRELKSALVNALRRAIEFMRSDKSGCSPVLTCDCENELTAILQASSEPKEN